MDVETPRLRIRDLVTEDLEPMVELWADPDVERWMTGYGPRSRSEVEAWMPETIGFNEASPREAHNCAIVELATGRVVGWIGFGPSSAGSGDEVNFGYAISARDRGIGYGTEAVRAAIAFCFDELGMRRCGGETAVDNDASARAMTKAGMRRGEVVDGQIQFLIAVDPREVDPG